MTQSLHRRLFLLIFSAFLYSNVHASSAAGQETLIGVVGKDFVMLGADSSVSQSISLTASNLDKIAVLVDPQSEGRQRTILAAAAGDAAHADRLIALLSAHCALKEFEASVGCDVEVYCSSNDGSTWELDESHSSPPGLSVAAVAHLARRQISSSLRTRQALQVCLLVAGMMPTAETDTENGSSFVSQQVQWQVEIASNKLQEKEDAMDSEKEQTLDTASSELQPRLYWLDNYGAMQKLQYGAHGFGSNFCLSILDRAFRPNLSRQEAEQIIRECFDQLRTRYVINSPQPPCIKCVDAKGYQMM